MDSDDAMDFEDENADEILEYETTTLASLRGKELTVQNADGTLCCPLSPSRKKQAYVYKDLLQHATAVASGKRGPEAAGKHSALKKFLESDLSSLATPAPERLLKVQQKELPRRRHAEEMLVCPWSVVVYNIDNSRRDPVKDIQIGLGKSELNIYFADFKPDKLQVLWGPQGHLGMCVVHFGRDLSGFKDAQALENSFLDKEHGLRDYERRLASESLGKEFYGWLAREDDLKGRFGRQGEEIGRYLRKVGNLKDIGMVGDEMKRIHDRLVLQLTSTVSAKNQESEELKTQMESIRRDAEAERLLLEESHKLELQAVQIKARNSEEEYNRATLESHRALEKREAELRQLDKELREKESHLESAAEKSILKTQLMENMQLREMLSKEQGLLQQKNADKVKLVQKHEEERRWLAEMANKAALQLVRKQKTEMEKQQLHTIIETERLFDKLTINPVTGHESKKVEELEQKLEELESSQEHHQDTITTLMIKERASNDEIVDARKMAVEVLQPFNKKTTKQLIEAALKKKTELGGSKPQAPQARVGVKMAGQIDESPWKSSCQKKYKNDDDWGLKMKKLFSEWEDLIRNSEFQPFKTVKVGEDKWEKQFDLENAKLSALKKQLGGEVYLSVTTALMEIEEYNASGRYPIPVPWIFEKSRKASLKEIVAYLGDVINALLDTNAPRKKPRS